jgi:hypothetical protein
VNAREAAGNGDALPVRDELATRLADVFGCPPDHARELTKVAQFVAVTRGVGPLYDELHALLEGEHAPGPVHRFLAELPPVLRERGVAQPLIVTTNYDRALEHAFRDAAAVVSCTGPPRATCA